MTTATNQTDGTTTFTRRMRWAGLCIIVGLVIQLGSLVVSHPVTFMLFLGPGVGLVALGAGIFLWAVFAQSQLGWNRFTERSSGSA